jgi:hypothetical protein
VSDLRNSLTEAILAPYSHPSEERLHAKRWVEETLSGQGDAALAEPLEQLQKFLKSPFPWATVLLLVASLVAATALLRPLLEADRLVGMNDPDLESATFLEGREFTPQQRLLLGDPRKPPLEQKEALWNSEPGNPAYFTEYVLAYRERYSALPPGYWETVHRIDPTNAWFDYVAMEATGANSVEKKDRGETVAPDWGIRREKEYRDALTLIASAREKPRFTTYSQDMLSRRIALLPQHTHTERLGSIVYLAGQSSSHVLVLNACSDLLAARVWETGKSRDVDGLRNALQDAEKLISRIVGHDQATLIELLCARGEMSKIARQAQTAAIECGNPDVAERFGTLRSALDERKKRLEAPTASNEWIRAQAGKVEAMLLSTPADMVENSPRLTPEDLLPGRLRDQSFYSALYSLASWLLLAVGMLLTFVYRFRGPALYRRLSKRLGSLLQFSDWAWILGGGILLPFLLWLAAVLLTPIGGRNATHPGHFLATPLLNLELLIGLFFVSPILFVRWRLGLRGNVLGFRKYTPWGWFSVFYLSALIAGISILPNPAGSVCGCGHVDWRELFPWRTLTFISLFPPIAWLGVTSGRALFSAASRLPHRMTAARALVTAYALGMLCLLGTAFGFLASYKRWSDQNPLLILSAEKPSLTPYDYQVTRQLQTELRALWK